MRLTKKRLTDTKIQLELTADNEQLTQSKQQVLQRLGRDVKVQGFRAGKVPPAMVEKSINPNLLQSEFLEVAVNRVYGDALAQEQIRTIDRPEVSIKKYVPFSELVFEATVEILGEVKLPDYTKIKIKKKLVSVTDKDIDEVIESLRIRAAEKKEVERAAVKDDEVWIDFSGSDAATGDPIQGADGKDYPLVLGSNTFIPGFEDNLTGVKPGQEKTFTITFPDNYGVKALQKRKVTFKATITKVNEMAKPRVDDAFAAKAGPFKSLAELKADIKKQLESERQNETERDYENELIEKIVEQSTVAVPKVLADEEIERLEVDERRNLTYRGQTWQEHLKDEGVTEEEHREQKRPAAENRVKAGLVLSEIAEKEKITVSPEELEIRLQLLKGQYQDKQMQAELDKPENRRDILSRMVTEKTLAKLKQYSSAV
jgi:trigger factor